MNIRNGLSKYMLTAAAAVLTSMICYPSVSSISAQGSMTGEWILEMKPGTDFVYFSIHRRSERGGTHSSSSDIRADSLKGLSAAQASGSGSAVSFQVVREAGTLNCEGWFKEGKGSGSFTFAPNQRFAAEMRSLGYEQLSDEKLFSMAVHDIGLTFIRELNALGYDHLTIDNLFAMRIHGAGPQFIKAMKDEGYDRVPVDNLVAMRIHGVKPEFIGELKSLGYQHPPIDQLVAMRIHGVSKEFVKEIKVLGFDRVSTDQLVAMRIHGVSSAFIQKMKTRGFNDASIDQLIELKIHGFDK